MRAITLDGELRVIRDGATYSIAKMSDGERIALILIAEVIAAKPNSIVLIDEPELHMHLSIVVPLIGAIILARRDCSFMVCTHELGLPRTFPSAAVIVVRGCSWGGATVTSWDITLLPENADIPEDIRTDIIGSRRKILIVEGDEDSLDRPIYALLFPDVSITCRRTCIEVQRAVDGIRLTKATHNSQAFGIVDNDGMDPEFQRGLESKGVFALPIFAVEALYYSPEVLAAVAHRQAETFAEDEHALLERAKGIAIASLLPSKLEYLTARVAERQMRDIVLLNLPTRDQLINGETNVSIPIGQVYANKLSELQQLVRNCDLNKIIARFPVRDSGMLNQLAKGLRLPGRLEYQQAALTIIGKSEELKRKLRGKLGALEPKLKQP